jgi:hypothetical protein
MNLHFTGDHAFLALRAIQMIGHKAPLIDEKGLVIVTPN